MSNHDFQDLGFQQGQQLAQAEIAALKAENERLRQALEKFADEDNWLVNDEMDGNFNFDWLRGDNPIEIAQAALGGEE